MKIVAFNGSPRGESGNTYLMTEEFLAGAREAGAETEHILLAQKKIGHCLGCLACWLKTPGKCVIADDMADLLKKFVSADIVVFATPVYVDNVTGLMKNFMDRLVPLADPRFAKTPEGECRHIIREGESPDIVVISNCGFPEQSHFQVLKLLFSRIARNMNAQVVAEIYRGGGEMLKGKNILLIPLIMRYKKLLRTAGKEVVEGRKVSAETAAALEKPLVADEMYIKYANEYFEKVLKEIAEKS
ncbi:MAG TPA: flavodoxin family protein [bacterium]|nr:flavodoxin family protein [bacterium]